MDATLIGYFPKQTLKHPDWLKSKFVEEICSVSECLSKGPEGWINHWKHNEMWVYDREEIALGVIPKEFLPLYDLYAYRIFPFSINKGKKEDFILPKLVVENLSSNYVFLG